MSDDIDPVDLQRLADDGNPHAGTARHGANGTRKGHQDTPEGIA